VDKFRVWVQPTDYGHVLCVEGMENARWLLDRLGRSFVFRSAEPISQDGKSSLCRFQLPGGPFVSSSKLQKLLTDMPEVMYLRVVVAT
jgi:hypothetical protein